MITTNNIISICFSTEDDLFNNLKKCFLMTGKGRRPDLPTGFESTKCTNLILLQLRQLQKTGNKSYEDVSLTVITISYTTRQ